MHKQSFSIGFACALGAFVGALVAMEIAARFAYGGYLWAFGALAGGIVAYVTVDFRELCTGTARAYSRTVAWRPNGLYWKALGMSLVGYMTLASTIAAVALAMAMVVHPVPSKMLVVMVGVIASITATIMAILDCSARPTWPWPDNFTKERLLRSRRQGYWLLVHANPFSAGFYAVYFSMRGTLYLVRHIPAAWAWCVAAVPIAYATSRAFAIQAFIYVHTERRTICFVDATIGAAAGYHFGSALIGAAIGAILGVVNYELVAIKWLKLIPAKTK